MKQKRKKTFLLWSKPTIPLIQFWSEAYKIEKRTIFTRSTKIQDSYNDVPDSIISNRIVAKIYLEDADYDNAIKICETGIALLQRTEFLDGKKLPK